MTQAAGSSSIGRELIQSLFPADVACILSDQLPPGTHLTPAEMTFTRKMSKTRFAEFCHGRYCARLMLRQLGVPETDVLVGESRQPLWPTGVVGSIAHWRNIAVAVGARTEHYACLGVDLESSDALAPELRQLICTREEIEAFSPLYEPGQAGKILFSIKESIFKCLWPSIGTYFDFLDVQVRPNAGHNNYSAAAVSRNRALGPLNRLRGRYAVTENWVISGAVLP